jgi:indolepyruvate ferredoxin oxidoreductase
LLTDPGFSERIAEQFEGEYRLAFHLSPPLLCRTDPNTGRPRKRRFGQWLATPLRWLAASRRVRGTPFDPFGYTAERRLERQLIQDYEQSIELLLGSLTAENHDVAVDIARLPHEVRGYGPVKMESVRQMETRKKTLLEKLHGVPSQQAA